MATGSLQSFKGHFCTRLCLKQGEFRLLRQRLCGIAAHLGFLTLTGADCQDRLELLDSGGDMANMVSHAEPEPICHSRAASDCLGDNDKHQSRPLLDGRRLKLSESETAHPNPCLATLLLHILSKFLGVLARDMHLEPKRW